MKTKNTKIEKNSKMLKTKLNENLFYLFIWLILPCDCDCLFVCKFEITTINVMFKKIK